MNSNAIIVDYRKIHQSCRTYQQEQDACNDEENIGQFHGDCFGRRL